MNPNPALNWPASPASGGIRVPGVAQDPLWRVRLKEIWAYLQTQPLSFWLICFYLFMEYVRPQQVWPVVDVLPWGQLAIWGSLAALLAEGKTLALGSPLLKLYCVFLLVVLASSVTAMDPSASWAKINIPISWFIVFVLITSIVNTERRFLIFMLSFLLYSSKMSQHGMRAWAESGFGFSGWGVNGTPGWFNNSGEFGIQMCVFFPLSVEFILACKKQWGRWKVLLFSLMPITAVASMIASSSRGALVGGAAVLLWMILRSRHRVRALAWGAVIAATVWSITPPEQKERFRTAGDDETSVSRTDEWKLGMRIAKENPVLGIGYNNWLSYDQLAVGLTSERARTGGLLPHNIFIEAMAELGYVGLFSFILLVLGSFWVNWGTRRIARSLGEPGRFLYHMGHGLDGALVGYLVSGFFVTVLHYPFFWINLAMCASLRIATRAKVSAMRRASMRPLAAPSLRAFVSPPAAARQA